MQRTSLSPGSSTAGGNSGNERGGRSPDAKRAKKDVGDVDGGGDKSDQDLVVDDSNDQPPANGSRSPKENGGDGGGKNSKDPLSPSSQRSTPASSKGGAAKEEKPGSSPRNKMSPPVAKGLAGLGECSGKKKKGSLCCKVGPEVCSSTHNEELPMPFSWQVTHSLTDCLRQESLTVSDRHFLEPLILRDHCHLVLLEENRKFLQNLRASVSSFTDIYFLFF